MKVRNYKNYTAVYLEEITSKEFKESMKKYTELKECEKYVVIRPTKKAAEAFAQLHSLPLFLENDINFHGWITTRGLI